jgi:type IV secretory pathway TrbD component
MPSERTRAYIYRILISLGSLAAVFGFITQDQIVAALGLAAAVLNVLPAANTSTRKE